MINFIIIICTKLIGIYYQWDNYILNGTFLVANKHLGEKSGNPAKKILYITVAMQKSGRILGSDSMGKMCYLYTQAFLSKFLHNFFLILSFK